ncbi:MAG TPA: hypothetical protein VMT02_05220 [Burkholderiales bacterium]|nr:hypothetical protein [Burkholderiales bacterium]
MIDFERYPTPLEIEALMRRARRERALAIAAMLAHAHARGRRALVVLRRRVLVAIARFGRMAGEELRYMS